ncbi:lasso peptide biosynthesis B2 protein [Sphingopyxis sp. 22461]|uniref:lasso peptide biosynthesis B2 protein n=1 Tax=Sphingopyxis sp. 22461 TaxID=3453923 RepID=UPI003F836F15
MTLAPGTGFCETAEELVFLDLARDKYLSLRGQDRAAFDRLRRGEPNDGGAIARLVATGLFVSTNGPGSVEPAAIDVPTRDLAAVSHESFSPRMALSTAFALRWARRAMRPEQIGFTIEAVRARKAGVGPSAADGEIEIVSARYAAARWLNPVPQRCLIDALALDHILLARGLASTMVFGIRMSPFKAHCWLQSPSAILTGTAAEARNFVPILVIR